MEFENKYHHIPIQPVRDYSRSWLSLQGTILIYQSKDMGANNIIEIPVELITLSRTKRVYGKRLIWALLSIIFVPAPFILTYMTLFYFYGDLSRAITDIFIASGHILTLLSFLSLLIWFFIKVSAVSLTTPDDVSIEFYLVGKYRDILIQLIDEIEKRKLLVQERELYPLKECQKEAIGMLSVLLWQTFFLMWLVSLFAGILIKIFNTRIFVFLIVIPAIWKGYEYLKFSSQPKLYRQAYRHYYKDRYPEALQAIEQLVSKQPDYHGAYPIFIDLLCKVGRFSDAGIVYSKLDDGWDPDYLRFMQDNLLVSKRFWKRKYGEMKS